MLTFITGFIAGSFVVTVVNILLNILAAINFKKAKNKTINTIERELTRSNYRTK